MRRLAIGLTPVFVAALGLGCAGEPEEPNAFQTQGNNDDGQESDTAALPDMAADEVGDGDGDGDGPGDGDGDPPTTGDGDGDPPTGDGDGDTEACGNGVIEGAEQCDGGNLGGYSCVDLGYSGGTLGCDPVICTYDASGCVTNTDGNTSGTTG